MKRPPVYLPHITSTSHNALQKVHGDLERSVIAAAAALAVYALGLTVTITFFHSLAFVVTTFRLIHRRRRKQCSWDDFWALVAVCCNNITFIFFWVRVRNNARTRAGHPPSRAIGRINYFIISLTFTAALWAARISITCSILRILPPGPTRTLVFGMTCVFGIIALALLFSKSWICRHDTSWSTDCPLGEAFNILKLTTDVVADVALVAVPLCILWHTSLPKGPRYMIRAVFATTILTASIGVLHAVYGMLPNLINAVTAHLESAVTVMLCNLLVVATFIYRRLWNGRDLDAEATTYATSRGPRPRAIGITFASFSKIWPTRLLTTSFSSVGRGTSVFLEVNPAVTNSHNLTHPSFTSDASSVESTPRPGKPAVVITDHASDTGVLQSPGPR
ncbi:hypothetical protein LshimejAT787_1403160 [Lyophyllum shimeji]|uniref:Rhodopsin domain-containing protein n=1 Tax=Lyophyllum shimeji TaxID=47721 RepID=A0A9P3PYA5_LYOSH|nr:hypothetical protein LshimejAT787_1403160 [Lyophyllum shimeji]